MQADENFIPPVFFAHGAPTLAVRDTPASRFLKSFSQSITRPRFILILSAHWETAGLKLSAPGPLRTYHDFGGFQRDLYEISYPASASPEAVAVVQDLLVQSGRTVKLDSQRGLDHGAWIPLSLAFPEADVPVVQLSLPHNSAPEDIYDLGTAVAPLTRESVLIIGSGGTSHNLRTISPDGSPPPEWAKSFDTWLEVGLRTGSIDYFSNLGDAPDFRQNHPTEEHLLPLFFPFGAAGSETEPTLLHRSYEYGSLSMSYFGFDLRSET